MSTCSTPVDGSSIMACVSLWRVVLACAFLPPTHVSYWCCLCGIFSYVQNYICTSNEKEISLYIVQQCGSTPGASCGSLSAAHGRIIDISEYIERNIKPGWCAIYHSSQAHCLGVPKGIQKSCYIAKPGEKKEPTIQSRRLQTWWKQQ